MNASTINPFTQPPQTTVITSSGTRSSVGLVWIVGLLVGLIILLWIAGSRRRRPPCRQKSSSTSSLMSDNWSAVGPTQFTTARNTIASSSLSTDNTTIVDTDTDDTIIVSSESSLPEGRVVRFEENSGELKTIMEYDPADPPKQIASIKRSSTMNDTISSLHQRRRPGNSNGNNLTDTAQKPQSSSDKALFRQKQLHRRDMTIVDTNAGDSDEDGYYNSGGIITSTTDTDVTIVNGVAVTQAGRSTISDEPDISIGPLSASSFFSPTAVQGGVDIKQDDAFTYIDMVPDKESLKNQAMPRSYWDKEYGERVREENKHFVELPPLPTHEDHMKAVKRIPATQMLSGRVPSYARTKGASTNLRDLYQPLPERKTTGLALHGMTESYFAAIDRKLDDPMDNNTNTDNNNNANVVSGDRIANLFKIESAFM